MKPTIFAKLFFSIVLGFSIVLICMMAWVQWSFRSGFENYLAQIDERRIAVLIPALAEAYRRSGSWDRVRENPFEWTRSLAGPEGGEALAELMPDGPPGREHHHPPPRHGPHDHSHPPPEFGEPPAPHFHPRRPPRDPMAFFARVRLLDESMQTVFGPDRLPPDAVESFYPIEADGRQAGTLAVVRPRWQFIDKLEQNFIDQQAKANYLVSALALVLSTLLAWLLARQFLKPIRSITSGAASLRAGRYDVTVPVHSGDELGRLAADFNQLARTLKQNEQARRQWVADISHELRTPIAVLRGEIEALQDGVREFSPQRLASLHGETLHLGKLVEDLYQLSITDLGALSYKMEPLDLAALIRATTDTFRGRFEAEGLELREMLPADFRFELLGDARRLAQLLGNVLENSLRYTEPPGFCEIRLAETGGWAAIDIDDTLPAVPDESLERLFERLYRVDESRGREAGGAGLGLAICRNIVVAHGGRIRARRSRHGGLGISIELPSNPGGGGEPS